MNTTDPNCPRCGAKMARRGALEGLCPACILRVDGAGLGAVHARDARQPDAPDLSEIQRDFPDLEILEEVGRGGMGIVYRARQTRLDRIVALKVLVPALAQDPAFAERFLREAQAMAKLQHPSVVTVYDFGERQGRYFLLMEFVEGPSLRRRIESGPLAPEDALRLSIEVCEGLEYAHELGIVHRDIKPENLLVDGQGRVRIADFGLARLLTDEDRDWRLTRASQVMGTPFYMSPEQISRPLEVDHRADLYSLGVVLYEMLMGVPPQAPYAPPSSLIEGAAELDELVLKALERDPERRFTSARELAQSAKEILSAPREARGDQGARPGAAKGWPPGRRIAFVNEDKWGGLQVAIGHVSLGEEEFVVEYRMRDCFEVTISDPKTLRIPLVKLLTADYESTFLGGGKIILTGRQLLTDDIAQFHPDSVRFKVNRANRQEAQKLVKELRARLERFGA